MALTYDESRMWTYWLRVFAPSDLAASMGVPVEAIEGFLIGLQRNGTIEDTGDRINGTGPEEPIFSFVPLPPGPTEHFTKEPPETLRRIGCYELAPSNRGMPIRLRSDREYRRAGSKPGEGHKMRLREKRYKKMQEAIEKRKEAQRLAKRNEPGFRPKAGKNRFRD